jgi:hypothetical protein
VQVVQRWILARMRKQTFFSLGELNARIAQLLDELNDRQMRRYGASRRELFERIDRPALKTLPSELFVYGGWKTAKVNVDYHVEVNHHAYSRAVHVRARRGRRADLGHDGRDLR